MLKPMIAALLILSPLTANAANIDDGKEDYMVYCAPCHGVGGLGDGPVSLELTKKPIDLTVIAKNDAGIFDENKIKMIVDGRSMPRSHGTPEMPVWGRWFSFQATAGGLLQEDRKTIDKQVDERLNNLIAYLKTIQK